MFPVAPGGRVQEAVDPSLHEVHHPDLLDPVPGVEGGLHLPVVGPRGVGHLHQEEDVFGARVGFGVEILPGLEEEEVGLGLAMGA